MANAFSGENTRVIEKQVDSLSDVLAETLKKEYELVRVIDREFGTDDKPAFAEGIARALRLDPPFDPSLTRLHRSLSANIETITPEPDSPGLEHLAFFQTLLLAQKKAAPSPFTPEDRIDEVSISHDRSLLRIQRLQEAGRILVNEWRESQGQYFVAKRPGEWKLGLIREEPSSALRMDYGDPQAMAPDFANWLLGVNDNYLDAALYYRGTGEAIASFQFKYTHRLVESLGVLYSAHLGSRFDLGERVHIPGNKTYDVLINDSAVLSLLRSLKAVDAIIPFIKLSDPDIAAPMLGPFMLLASHADLGDVVKQVQIHHEKGKGKERQLNEVGRKWLKGLGITG